MIIRHEVGVPGLKKPLTLFLFLLPATLAWISCGGSTPSNGQAPTLKYRAFLTNDVSSTTSVAGLYVVNAETDAFPGGAPISAGNTPSMMVVTPNRADTLVFSGNGTQSDVNQLTVVANATQSSAGQLTLPGITESFVVSPDSSTAYVALPTAPVTGQSPGVVAVVGVTSADFTSQISCPPVNPANPICVWPASLPQGFNPPYRYLSISNTGDRILAFSSGANAVANAVAVISPSSVGTLQPVVTFVDGVAIGHPFDHPVWAYFNGDDTTAYVVNCGAECGGQQASVQPLDLTTNPPTPGVAVPVPAASVALVSNSTMYLAGTPLPASPCTGEMTAATTCGLLTVFDLNSMSVVGPPAIITDGYHNHIALGANGQLFIGARNCTEIIPPLQSPAGTESRGCLSIYNTLMNTTVGTVPGLGVLIPSVTGEVTGIQPIPTREVVYVVQGRGVQGGTLYIYDATLDALEIINGNTDNPGQIFGLIGDFGDVKTVDF